MPIFLWKLIEGENIMGAIYGWQYGNTCLDTKRLRYVIYYTYSNHNFTKMLCTQWSLTFRLHVVDSILAICRYNFTPKCCVPITLPRVICKWWSNQLLTKISLGCSSRLPSLFNQHAMHEGVIQHVPWTMWGLPPPWSSCIEFAISIKKTCMVSLQSRASHHA